MKLFVPVLWVLFVLLVLPTAAGRTEETPKLTDPEQKILDQTNKERAAKDLPPLMLNPTLTKVARAHSANMAKQGKMDHVLDGKKPGDRLLDAGYDYADFGENIASGQNWSVDAVMKGWMESPQHRKNILSDEVNEIGVGIASDDKGTDFYTVEFGKRRK